MDIKERESSFDSIKYLLMVCVVFGHTIGPLDNTGLNAKIFSFINSFHMPAFVLISGYFYKDIGYKRFWKGILEFLFIILIFQIIYSGGGWKVPVHYTWEKLIYRITHMYFPQRAMWYILSLCWWRIMMRYYPRKIRDNFAISIPIALILSVFIGFVPIGVNFSFQRTFTFFPYFLIGYCLHEKGWWNRIRCIKKWKSLLWLTVCFFIILMIPVFPDWVLTGSLPYNSKNEPVNVSVVMAIIYRVLSYIWMLPMAICVLCILPDGKFFSTKGKDTLFYLLYHPFFIWVISFLVIKNNIPTSFPFMIIYVAVNMTIMYWLSKIKFFQILTKPFSLLSLLKKI